MIQNYLVINQGNIAFYIINIQYNLRRALTNILNIIIQK